MELSITTTTTPGHSHSYSISSGVRQESGPASLAERYNRHLLRSEGRTDSALCTPSRMELYPCSPHPNCPTGSVDSEAQQKWLMQPHALPSARTSSSDAGGSWGIPVRSHLPSALQQEPPAPATQAGTWQHCMGGAVETLLARGAALCSPGTNGPC